MSAYEFYCRIFDKKFLAKEQDRLLEPKERKQAIICLNSKGINNYRLYKFDSDFDFLPFFNKKHNGSGEYPDALEGVSVFCDYILLVEYHGELYFLLLELKSGNNIGAKEQLSASELFVKYIEETAKRVASSLKSSVNVEKVKIKKFIVKSSITKRSTTKINRAFYISYDSNNSLFVCSNKSIGIMNLCQAER